MQSGSSPLTRGKQAASRGCCIAARLIPTHAGKTATRTTPRPGTPAHPHSRGENCVLRIRLRCSLGSSPLTRGKPEHAGRNLRRRGLIPTHAGKTLRSRAGMSRPWAHPRSCGENLGMRPSGHSSGGSSPLMRGKRKGGRLMAWVRGLIPAHARKTPNLSWRKSRSWAHPRSREENPQSFLAKIAVMGSSPLTRGKPHAQRSRRLFHRLIPAHAGKTSCLPPSFTLSRAHPHSRGENRPPLAT